MIATMAVTVLWSTLFYLLIGEAQGFVPLIRSVSSSSSRRIQPSHPIIDPSNIGARQVSTTSLFENKLWDRMQIEEDDEPMWYVLNCVAGLELDLLRQCRQRCEGMPDVEKFVVPMMTSVRSHGANRMVKDTKVKYQGYVFAKLRLCPETYEAIQELDMCRSWMGTINIKGHKKLPPAPLSLNEDEIEKFGLENLEAEEAEEPQGEEDDIILDSVEADEEAAEMEETVRKVYKGLRVEDMVKVTAKNKFYNEDAVVRRLKDGKLFLRFYTYGSMYEEWMDPGDVRKLSSIEILKGLSGPQQPVTQRDFDGPDQGDRRGRYDDDQRPGDIRRDLQGAVGGGPRNRRQDRTASSFQRDNGRDQQRNDNNWNWYQENERRNQGGGYRDGNVDIRGSDRGGQRERRDNNWAQGDVDSQWGRTTQRQNRREKQQRPSGDDGDWSAFVSPAKDRTTQAETDDFFASLMTDLSKDMDSKSGSQDSLSRDSSQNAFAAGGDDFFASLISEIDDGARSSSKKEKQALTSDEDDFFASLAGELDDSSRPSAPPKKSPLSEPSDDDFFASLAGDLDNDLAPAKKSKRAAPSDDDFFASLAGELGDALQDKPEQSDLSSTEEDFFAALTTEVHVEKSAGRKKATTGAENLDDFFAGLGPMEDSDSASTSVGESDDFFAGLEAELESQLSVDEPVKKASPSKSKAKSTSKDVDVSKLEQCTIPVLKDMLREKGLKLTGKKSELIERLAGSQ